MTDPVERIVIVGGGTAGWLSALFLSRALNSGPLATCSITLVESSDIGTIGVGEATLPSLKNTLAFCGLDEADWMRECNASFKLAIKFVDWAPRRGSFWHPFGPQPSIGGLPLSHHWLRRRLRGWPTSYAEACFPAVALCRTLTAPKAAGLLSPRAEPDGDGGMAYRGEVDYAYHVDAGLLADYLKRVARGRGVRHVVDRVTEVVRRADGGVDAVRTESSGDLPGDLFLDCSGFAGLLINKTLHEPFVPFGDVLLCDSAIAMPVPTDDARDDIEPYTTSTALQAGWAWRTPLYGRSGNGYVYSSAFLSPEEAEREFRDHLGRAADGRPARHLRMRVGRTRNAWVENCVGIGLSSGFIEPLESTGIWFIELALYNLMWHFPGKRPEPAVVAHFNDVMRRNYEQVRDFLVLHYCLTPREDTAFWRANRATVPPESLGRGLELWQATLPAYDRLVDPGLFKDLSFVSILDGMGRLPRTEFPLLHHRGDAEADETFAALRDRGEHLSRSLPHHYDYLARLHGRVPAARV
ncbi:tryptophan halogenase family protein [Geodermatophilus sp. SYSU D00697]